MLSYVFSYIKGRFYSLAYYFSYIGNWLEDHGIPWKYLAPYFYSARDLCHTIGNYFYDAYLATRNLETLLDDAWTKAKQAFDYAYDVLKDKVNGAITLATKAWEYAVDAYNLTSAVLKELPYSFGFKIESAFETVWAIANVIGTTAADIVDFVKENATKIYQTINEYITNVYQTFVENITNVYETIKNYITNVYETVKNYITNVYQTVNNVFNTYVTNIIGVAEDWVRDFVSAALAVFTAPFNLINLWFDDIQDFFNSPLDWLEFRFSDWFFGPEK